MTTTDVKIMPALCLDLDGTVRYSKNGKFINKPEDIALFEGVEEKLWKYRNNGYLILGISNQGGIAFGIKTYEEERYEIEVMMSLFKESPFHFVKTCPYHPKGTVFPYMYRSLMRKPDYGMLMMLEAEATRNGIVIDWNKSLMVGDRPEDQQCADNASIAFQWAHEFFGREKVE